MDDAVQTLHFVLALPEHVAVLRVLLFLPQLLFHDLEIQIEAVQGIPDLVGHARGEERDRLHRFAFHLAELAAAAFGDVAQDHRGQFRVVGQRHQIELDETGLGIADLQLLPGDLVPNAAVGVEDPPPVHILKQLVHPEIFQILGQGQQFRRRVIEVADLQLGIDDEDPFFHGVEDRFEKAPVTDQTEQEGLTAPLIEIVEPFIDPAEKIFLGHRAETPFFRKFNAAERRRRRRR